MRETRHYEVAGHAFAVSGEGEDLALMENYAPFAADGQPSVFDLSIERGAAPSFTEELRQEDEGQVIVCGRTADGQPVFEFVWAGATAGWLVCSADYREGRLATTGSHTKLAIDNALMVLYALATAGSGTVLFHAAVVSHGDRAYMFLGPSGTGKSTHARLWLKHIDGTELMNDDNPVVRIGADGRATVYGSPWSGKTPCYRNVSRELGAIVLLSQAPFNKIRRLGGLEAYAALVPSISGKRWDERIADGLHQTENALVSTVPTWYLQCLPDEEAARLCAGEIQTEIQTPPLTPPLEGRGMPVAGADAVPSLHQPSTPPCDGMPVAGADAVPLPSRGGAGVGSVTTTHDDAEVMSEVVRLVAEGVSVTLPVNGMSMLPFIIGGRESVVLQKPAALREGQVVLAWVDGARYVVHRIIGIDGEHITLMGDGNLVGTEHCTAADVKGVVTHVMDAQERMRDLYSWHRRWAARLWRWLRPVRRYLLAIYIRLCK
jgi:SOS-response transcriptional repressor LexA